MSKAVAIKAVTVDGVVQAPGSPEEGTCDGFTHGGRGARYVDDQALVTVQARVAEGGGGGLQPPDGLASLLISPRRGFRLFQGVTHTSFLSSLATRTRVLRRVEGE